MFDVWVLEFLLHVFGPDGGIVHCVFSLGGKLNEQVSHGLRVLVEGGLSFLCVQQGSR